MNKLMFWSGLGMIASELLGVLTYLIVTTEWIINWKLILIIIVGCGVALFNIIGIIFMLVGALSRSDD
jgi:hypothetical protein